jgi:predicted ester cyclase
MTLCQVEHKKIIQRYFEAYNNKAEAIFDEIIASDYVDHGEFAYMGFPGIGVSGAKNDLRNSLDKFEDFNYVIEDLIGSEAYPDLVDTYWKGTLTPKAASSGVEHFNNTINYRGVSIYRFQNGKMTETWHVVDGFPLKYRGEMHSRM